MATDTPTECQLGIQLLTSTGGLRQSSDAEEAKRLQTEEEERE